MAGAHWTEDLFLGHEEVFRAIHEHGWPYGEEQVQHLVRILEGHGLPKGAHLLDAPCGIGRHATRLAKLGYRTVGVDLAPSYVARAQELAEQEGVAPRTRYIVGDLRRLREAIPEEERPFDGALNLWTSLGYYDEATDLEILRQFADLVRPGGLLVLETVNRDFLVRHFDPQGTEAFGDLIEVEQRRLDLATSRMWDEWRFFRKRGEDLVHVATINVDHRVYSLHELRSLMERAGWRVEGTYAGLREEAPSLDAPRLLLVGRQ